jgi:hypothetical protein
MFKDDSTPVVPVDEANKEKTAAAIPDVTSKPPMSQARREKLNIKE